MEIQSKKLNKTNLLYNEQIIQALLHSSIDTIIITTIDGMILDISKIAAKRLGKNVSDLIDKNIFNYMPQNLVESRKKQAKEAINSGKPVRFEDNRAGIYFDNIMYVEILL